MKKYLVFLVGLILIGGSVASASNRPTTFPGGAWFGNKETLINTVPADYSYDPASGDVYVQPDLFVDSLYRTSAYRSKSISPLQIWNDHDGVLYSPTQNGVDGANIYQTMLPNDSVHKLVIHDSIPDNIYPTPQISVIVYGYFDYPVATANYGEIAWTLGKQIAGVTPDITGFTGTPVSINNDTTAIQAIVLDLDATTSTWNAGDSYHLKLWLSANGGVTTENFRVVAARTKTQQK